MARPRWADTFSQRPVCPNMIKRPPQRLKRWACFYACYEKAPDELERKRKIALSARARLGPMTAHRWPSATREASWKRIWRKAALRVQNCPATGWNGTSVRGPQKHRHVGLSDLLLTAEDGFTYIRCLGSSTIYARRSRMFTLRGEDHSHPIPGAQIEIFMALGGTAPQIGATRRAADRRRLDRACRRRLGSLSMGEVARAGYFEPMGDHQAAWPRSARRGQLSGPTSLDEAGEGIRLFGKIGPGPARL